MFKKPLFSYLFINFVITWGLWFVIIFFDTADKLSESSPFFILFILGGLLGPILGALLAKIMAGQQGALKGFMKEIIKVKIKWVWYFYAVLVPLCLTMIPRIIDWLITGKLDLTFTEPLYMAFLSLPIYIIAGGLEESGWRGVMLPQLLKKYSILVSTIILIPTWTLWHFPLWLIKGTPQYGSSFAVFFLSVTVLSILLTVLYIETKSIFICIIFHAFSNSFGAVIGNMNSPAPATDWISTFIKLLICFLFFAWYLHNKKHSKNINKEQSVVF
jgi:uncharacterized protein